MDRDAHQVELLETAIDAVTRVMDSIEGEQLNGWHRNELTLSQLRALYCIKGWGQATPSAIAEWLDVHPSTVTELIQKLVDRNYVERGQQAGDRRVITLVLTRQGAAVLRDSLRAREDLLRNGLRRLPPDKLRELAVLASELAEAVENIAGEDRIRGTSPRFAPTPGG
jgi:MarR family transcriptional regulator, organic hydroperoxide resistance regulator